MVATFLAALLLAPRTGLAHAYIERADPAPGSQVAEAPKVIQAVFTEPLEGSFSRLQVLDLQREPVDSGDSRVVADNPRAMEVSLPADLPDGIYTVSWRTLSQVDGHTVHGAYPLIVGDVNLKGIEIQAATVETRFSIETAFARWWLALAGSVLFGSLLAWRTVLRPATRDVTREDVARRIRLVAVVGGGALLAGALYSGLAQAASVASASPAGDLSALENTLGRGRFATLWWARTALALLALGLVVWRGVKGWPALTAMAATAGVLLTSSLNSHAAALASGAHLAIAVDWLHFLGVAAWLGGIVALLVVGPLLAEAAQPWLPRAIGRFTAWHASVAIAVIAATGVFQTWLHVGSVEGLLSTSYGLSIVAKVVLMALMMAAGGYSGLYLQPRLMREVGREAQTWRTLAARFGRVIRLEIVFGVLALVAAAALTGLAPAREELARERAGEETAGPVDRTVNAQGLPLSVEITPGVAGVNELAVAVPAAAAEQVEEVRMILTYLEAEQGSQPLVLERAEDDANVWRARSLLISQPGRWQAEILVRRLAADDARTAVRFTALGAGATAPPSSVVGAYPLLPSAMASVALGLVIAGLLVFGFGALRPGRVGAATRAAVAAAGVVVVLCGGYVYARESSEGMPLDVVNVRNPVPPDQRSLEAGRETYLEQCAVCHGDTGRGDGPGGLRLVPRPADLREHMAAGHTDGELFYWVTYGVPGTAMPAFGEELSERERWDVINFLRTFAQTPAP